MGAAIAVVFVAWVLVVYGPAAFQKNAVLYDVQNAALYPLQFKFP